MTHPQLRHRSMLASRSAELATPQLLTGLPDLQVRALTDRAGAQLVLRADQADAGEFDGYACRWNVVDSYGTSFRQGCFVQGGLDAEPYALLWMHDPWVVLGLFYAQEDELGLRIAGRWDDTDEGQRGRGRARSGSANGLSVGFVPIGTDPDDSNVFTSTRLVETSQITRRMAAVPGAELQGVRTEAPDARQRRAQLARARLSLR